jgi:hypothetical protein
MRPASSLFNMWKKEKLTEARSGQWGRGGGVQSFCLFPKLKRELARLVLSLNGFKIEREEVTMDTDQWCLCQDIPEVAKALKKYGCRYIKK